MFRKDTSGFYTYLGVPPMTVMLSKDIFAPNGESLAALVEAKVIQTETTGYDLVL
ncbi:MAG: hypothetical protein ACRC0V_11780 [Fusobacteriaceae bacterium]